MRQNCSTCSIGGYDPLSDYCDSCMNDSNTGWAGFYDHRVNKDFISEKEQRDYYRDHENDEYDEDDYII